METVIDILESLESDNSRNYKEEVLRRHRDNSLLKRVFTAVGDPYVNYYVSKFKTPKSYTHHEGDDVVVQSFLDLITDKLSTRELTGNAAKGAVERFFLTLDERQAKWCTRILLKNLRCGVQETTVNKVWPGSVTKFSVQLAESLKSTYDPDSGVTIHDELSFPLRVESKLDGLRCVAVKHDGTVTMFTRNGTVLDTLPTIKAVLEAAPWDDFVLDGEAMGRDWNESASVVMSHKTAKDDSGMVYNVFDAIPFSDWQAQECPLSLTDRLEVLAELMKALPSEAPVKAVPGDLVDDVDALLKSYSKSMDAGHEGVMVKDLDAPYVFKRSDAVRKLKPVATFEGVVVGHYEGTRGSKREGMWGGFHVVMPNGVVTRVGGGFTDKMKAEIDVDPDAWIGRVLELEGQPDPLTDDGFTQDGKVRFPVFVRERNVSDVDPRVLLAGEEYLKNNVA